MTAHAPGWSWRKPNAGQVRNPWAFDMPAHLGGLCEKGFHDDCPQAPRPTLGETGTCSCGCHQQITGQSNIDDFMEEP